MRFYLVVWLFSKRPLSISLGINCLCMHYTNTKVCRSLLSWNHARNPIEDDLHYKVFKIILRQKKWSKLRSMFFFTHFHLFVYQTFKSCFLKHSCSLVQRSFSDTLYYSNRHYKMSSTYKIHLPNGKSWLTLQKGEIVTLYLVYYTTFPKNFCFFPS